MTGSIFGSPRRRAGWVTIAVAFAGLAGCSLIKTSSSTSSSLPGGGTSSAPEQEPASAGGGDSRVTVPNLMGKTREEAVALVQEAGFTSGPESSRPTECHDAARDPGKINCQDPEPGKSVMRYTVIQINVFQGQDLKRIIVRDQLASLRGLTPDAARAQLKKLGHDGEVTISIVTDSGGGQSFDKNCGADKVCHTSGESGIGIHDRLTLYVNPKLSIELPPE